MLDGKGRMRAKRYNNKKKNMGKKARKDHILNQILCLLSAFFDITL